MNIEKRAFGPVVGELFCLIVSWQDLTKSFHFWTISVILKIRVIVDERMESG